MKYSDADIQNNARSWPRVTTGATLNPHTRVAMETLAAMCGVAENVLHLATDNDLAGICMTARKDAAAARRVADKVQLRLMAFGAAPDPILGGDPIPAPRAPEPTPRAPGTGATDEVVKRWIAEASRVARDHTDAKVGQLEKDVNGAFNDLRDALPAVVKDMVGDIPGEVAKALKALTPTILNVSLDATPAIPLGLVHKSQGPLIQALAAGVNVYLHGPAGSGKTTGGRKAAEAFGTQFYFAAKVESEYQLLGFTDAKGAAVRTPFREAYEHGGVFLFDEMDASSPAAVVALNAALANGICPFPDGIVARHAAFHCIGAGNTKLTGASRQYAGRNKLDAASIDRFAFMEWGYDDGLERAIATDAKWCEYVQNVRKACADRGIDHLVTPRATYDGCKLLACGFTWDDAAAMCVFKGLDPDTVAQITAQVSKAY